MTLELFVEDQKGKIDESIEYPLLKIIADDRYERQYLEISSGESVIQIPISKVKEMIGAAEQDVHSETWFDKNVFKEDKNT